MIELLIDPGWYWAQPRWRSDEWQVIQIVTLTSVDGTPYQYAYLSGDDDHQEVKWWRIGPRLEPPA